MLELGKMCQMKQWDVYYMVLDIDFYILRKKVYWKRTILKRGINLPVKLPKLWEEAIFFCIDTTGFQHKYNTRAKAQSIRTMAWKLKNEGLHLHCTAKGSHVGSAAHFIVAIANKKELFYMNSIETKLMETCYQVSTKHTFKNFSVDAGFQKAKGFFKMDVLYKTVKRQDKLCYS